MSDPFEAYDPGYELVMRLLYYPDPDNPEDVFGKAAETLRLDMEAAGNAGMTRQEIERARQHVETVRGILRGELAVCDQIDGFLRQVPVLSPARQAGLGAAAYIAWHARHSGRPVPFEGTEYAPALDRLCGTGNLHGQDLADARATALAELDRQGITLTRTGHGFTAAAPEPGPPGLEQE